MNMLAELHKDHINMSKLLAILEKNIKSTRQGAAADLPLMAEAIEYIGHYADVYHHPLEDIMYTHFAGRSRELDALMRQCQEEHRQLHAQTEQVLLPISEILLDGIQPLSDILSALEKFIATENQHLNFEEAKIFPLIESIASAEDWEVIARKAGFESDTIDEFEANQYAAIYAELAQAAR
ncbi:MAG: hypothetical protein OFPII_24610 [Osedax symbiont Rs1]|nr:MAG: hypothetical protein OFPII_24610 [Osedax symbiont Rs1]